MNHRRFYCAAMAALFAVSALSLTGCSKDDEDSGVYGDFPVTTEPVVDENGNEIVQLAMNKMRVSNNFHADVESDINLNIRIGEDSKTIPITSMVSADVTPDMTYVAYSGTDVTSDGNMSTTYKLYSNSSTHRVYTDKYGNNDWVYVENGTAFPINNMFQIPEANYEKIKFDSENDKAFSIALSDMTSRNVSTETTSESVSESEVFSESSVSGDSLSRDNVTDLIAEEVNVEYDDEDNISNYVPNDVFEYLEQNYDLFSGDAVFTLDDDGNIVTVTITDAKNVIVQTKTNDVDYEMTIDMNVYIEFSQIGEINSEAVAMPSDIEETAVAYVPTYDSDNKSDSAVLSELKDDVITTFKLDNVEFKVPMDKTTTIEGWTGKSVADTLWAYSNPNYTDCDIFAVTDNDSIIGLTVNVYPSYVEANAGRDVLHPDDEKQGEYPILKLPMDNVSWGSDTDDIMVAYGPPSAVVENGEFTDYTYTKIIDDMVCSCTFSVYKNGGFMSYSVNIAYL